MKMIFLALVFAARLAYGEGPAADPSTGQSTGLNTGATTFERSSEDANKEVEAFNRQADQVLQQVDKLVGVKAPDPRLEFVRQKAMRLAGDDVFLRAAQELWKSPARKKLILTQIGFFFLMTILRSWRQSRSTHWFRRLLLGYVFALVTWVGLVYVIPLAVLGEPFGIFTGTLFKVIFSR